MKPYIEDPEGNELRYLNQHASIHAARVLEIGCGEGRLTWQYGEQAGTVAAIDPSIPRLGKARGSLPVGLARMLIFVAARAEALPFPAESFDLAILSYSL